MSVENYTKRMYDRYGEAYQISRDEKRPARAYNEFLEVPCMLSAVGRVKGKRLLDIGCGAGVHASAYIARGAKVYGIDISESMINLARKRCPNIELIVGSVMKLPYSNASFDLVTASLSLDYVKDLGTAFREVSRVLKKGGFFYFSNESPINMAREDFENDDFKVCGTGYFIDKKTGFRVTIGDAWTECLNAWEMLPGMIMKTYKKTFRTHLLALQKNGLELVDFIDCKPTSGFKKVNPSDYEIFKKFPIFSIYVCKKK